MPHFEAPSGDLPLLLQLAEDEWHEIDIDLDSVEAGRTEPKEGSKKGWSCYFATINGEEESEIPFWAMKPFYEFVDSLPKKEQRKAIALRYRRTLDGKKNTAEFKRA